MNATSSPIQKMQAFGLMLTPMDYIIEMLQRHNIEMNVEPETFYGRKVVSFKDTNGFDIFFSCAVVKK
jgi:hypothetical protein